MFSFVMFFMFSFPSFFVGVRSGFLDSFGGFGSSTASPSAAGQSALLVLFVTMFALTPASSTPTPFPRALFATLVSSRRRVLERRRREALAQGLLVRRLHLGSSCLSLHAV